MCALTLRPQSVGIGPLVPQIRRDLGASHALVGLLGTLPVLGMGLFAPVAFYLVRGRTGFRAVIAVFVAMIALGGLARAAAPGIFGVLLLTVPIAVGIGVVGAALPGAVKERFADRPGFATGIYATGINVGAAVSALLAIPLAHSLGGWRAAIAVFSGASVLFAVGWVLLARQPRAAPDAREPRAAPALAVKLARRRGLGRRLALIFGLQGICYYGLTTWLAASYVERGFSAAAAGALVGVFNFMCIPGSLFVPWLADRFHSRQPSMLICAGMYVVGLVGLLLAPGEAWLWAAICGVANGALFALNLTLPLDAGGGRAEVGVLTAKMLGAGYVIAAISPFALGAVRDGLGSFTGAMWVLVATSAVLCLAILALGRPRLRRPQNVADVLEMS